LGKSVIVGGGLSGLSAARILSHKGLDISLVEKSPNLGGLLRSKRNKLGHVFDKGTHFISETTIPALNELLFSDLDFSHCHQFDGSMKVGSYFAGTLNEDSDCINSRCLPENIYSRGLVEMLESPGVGGRAKNMADFCLNTYGETFTEHIFAPVVAKLANLPLSDLDQEAANVLAVNRLVVLDREASKNMKKLEVFDKKIAWAHRDDGHSSSPKWYSVSKGVGIWASSIERRVRSDGVRILTESSINEIIVKNKKVTGLVLDGGEPLECDLLVWTIPPAAFLKTLKINHDVPQPKFRQVHLFDYSIDTELQTDLHCIVNFDPGMVNSRLTLFPNITTEKRVGAPHHLTVEVITERDDPDRLSSEVFSELKAMGVVLDKTKILWQEQTCITPGWPIITKDFSENSLKILELAEGVASNVTFAGRGKGENSHFMFEVLEDLYKNLL